MDKSFSMLDIGQRLEFANIEDCLAVLNGEITMEEATRRLNEAPQQIFGSSVVTSIDTENGVVIFDA